MSAADLSIAEAQAQLASGALSSVELTEAVLARASMTEAQLHSFLHIDHAGARAAAEAADSKIADGTGGSLAGIPIALKDNMVTEGIETTCSSKILSGWVPPYDGALSQAMKAADAVMVGKTNLDEFAMGSSTENSAFGTSRNPWDTDRVPGGSSGGSAVAVTIGSALGSFGSDTGGSIRQPASLCGIVGMKPTYGLVSRFGLIAFASSLDQIGPFSRTVQDSVSLLEAAAGPDKMDATSYKGAYPNFGGSLGKGVSGLRIGVVKEFGGEGQEAGVTARFDATVAALEAAGAEVLEVSLPHAKYSVSIYYLIAPAECSANLARFDGVRYGLRVDGETVEDMMRKTRAEGFGPEVTRRILLGTYALSAGYYDAFYGQARRLRTLVIRDFATAYETCDVLVSPTSPTTAFKIGERSQDPLAMYLSDIYTIPSNLAGHPAISVPVGSDDLGLPVGFQIMAPALGEEMMYQVADAVETLMGRSPMPVLSEVAS